MSRRIMRRMTKIRMVATGTSTYAIQANLGLKKLWVPGAAVGRNTGNKGCEIGIEVGTIKGCATFAMIGGFRHSCNA